MPAELGNWTDGIVVKSRYTIASLLGKGGMGEVYRAWDGDLRTDVVIKAPLPETLKNPEFVERFEREIRSLVRLAHPHIVRVTDCGSHRGLPFAVMQFLPGGSLKDRYAATEHTLRPAPPEELESWLPGVASALDFIHGQGYIHRDVKPANILFDGHGNPYLSDFGIAKVHADNAAGMTKGLSLTAQNMVLGTPEYMAPELIMGRPADGRVDQYALAVTVYEVLCGQPPFQGQPTAILVMHTGMQPPPLSQFVGGVSPALEQVVVRGMAKTPEERFPNCAAFARAVVEAVRAGGRPARATMMEARAGATQPVVGVAPGPRTTVPQGVPPRPPSYAPTPPSGMPTQTWGVAGSATVVEGMNVLGGTMPSHISAEEMPVYAPSGAAPIRAKKSLDRKKLVWAGGIAASVLAMIGTFALGFVRARSGDDPHLPRDEIAKATPLAAADEKASFTNGVGMTMICVRPGRFTTLPKAESIADGTDVITTPYWISAHEVTVGQYFQFLQSEGEKDREEHHPDWLRQFAKAKAYPREYEQMGAAFRQNGAPIVGIRPEDAEAFCRWLTKQEGGKQSLTYRLPTRQEWQCAARAGTATRFSWGDEASGGKFNGKGSDDGDAGLSVVGRYPANAWGLFDVAGNAREMVTSPLGLAGGGWDSAKADDVAPDHFEASASPSPSAGFRVVAVGK